MNRRGFLRGSAAASALALFSRAALGQSMSGGGNPYANVSVADQNLYRHLTLASNSEESVGIQLVLAMDTSGSISDEELRIELGATAYALNSQLVRSAIKYKSGAQSVAISVIDFDYSAMIRVPWVDIRGDQINDKPYNPDDPANSSDKPDVLDALANEIDKLPRRGSGGTELSTAIDLSYKLFLGCPWQATEKRALDLFGDGSSSTYLIERSRALLAQIGGTINGFAIVNDEPNLDDWFRENLVTKDFIRSPDGIWSEKGRVWSVARNLKDNDNKAPTLKAFFEEVARGMKQKISIEISSIDDYNRALRLAGEVPHKPVPEPV